MISKSTVIIYSTEPSSAFGINDALTYLPFDNVELPTATALPDINVSNLSSGPTVNVEGEPRVSGSKNKTKCEIQ